MWLMRRNKPPENVTQRTSKNLTDTWRHSGPGLEKEQGPCPGLFCAAKTEYHKLANLQ